MMAGAARGAPGGVTPPAATGTPGVGSGATAANSGAGGGWLLNPAR
jgi:hypothetical protein